MSLTQSETKQVELQKEAHELLRQLDLINVLSEYGEVFIAGSLVTNLMTWPDIDIEVITDTLPDRAAIGKLAAKLFANPDNERMVLLDNTQGFNPHYKSGVHLMFEQKKWKVDIWFFLPTEQNTGREYAAWLRKNLTEDKRRIILAIKEQITSNPKYRKEIFSVDIYEAVIKEDVKDLEGFEKYLQRTKRSLE